MAAAHQDHRSGSVAPRISEAHADLVFRSASILRALEEIDRFACDRFVPLLIEGESGTGKTLVARRVHARSPRASGPFETVVLSALDDALSSSELFGHVAGAYTDARTTRVGLFAAAHGGTLFLDEIAKASPSAQQKLLHAIEYGEIRPLGSDRTLRVDTRIVAASNLSLEGLVEDGRFLPDLHARLETFRVTLPPLRERRADIPILVRHYAQLHAARAGRPTPEIEPALMNALQRATWRYNLRQLSSTMHRLVLEAEAGEALGLHHCRGSIRYLVEFDRDADDIDLVELERAMARSGNNVSRAASALGIARTTVYRRLRQLQSERTVVMSRPGVEESAQRV
jgi:DNA-binding NtrC family response regulator